MSAFASHRSERVEHFLWVLVCTRNLPVAPRDNVVILCAKMSQCGQTRLRPASEEMNRGLVRKSIQAAMGLRKRLCPGSFQDVLEKSLMRRFGEPSCS